MLKHETLDEFNIYKDIVGLRLKADARAKGRLVLDEALQNLRSYSALGEEALRTIAQGEAQRAEDLYTTQWRQGQHRSLEGMAIGTRALIHGHNAEELLEVFVPESTRLESPEVVLVDLTDTDEVLGLKLPQGTFSVGDVYGHDPSHLYLYSGAEQIGTDQVRGVVTWPHQHFSLANIIEVTDAGGALWRPDY
jgi:hypothetical protein